ncbi:MAG TPA: winged helix-turn-helix domain-containing protein [Terriglobales bacterium]|nr:winged helix-turn-helix domain-containing protein [Terriglobales bacterium]
MKYRFGEFEADVRAAELRRGGTRLKLQLQPFELLLALLERPQDVVTREELRLRLWPEDTFVDFDHGLNTAVAKLRDVLGDSAASPKYIETVAKRGYRFLGQPEVISQAPAASVVSAGEPGAQPTPGSSQPSRVSSSASPPVAADEHLPRASRGTSRTLFILAQVMYLIFYLSALFSLENLQQSAQAAWNRAGQAAFVIYLVTALVGVAVRLYLIAATALDYHLLGQKYRVLFPALFVLDMIWALSPLLLEDRMGWGMALGACAALIYMPFAQRVLMKMIARPTNG